MSATIVYAVTYPNGKGNYEKKEFLSFEDAKQFANESLALVKKGYAFVAIFEGVKGDPNSYYRIWDKDTEGVEETR